MVKSKKQGFKYRGRDRTVESVSRRSRQAGGSFDGFLSSEVQMFKVKEGECCVRILPPTWDDTEKWGDGWEIGIHLHYNVGPDDGAYLCPDKMHGDPCPICEARRNAVDEDEADDLRPGWRALCWVIDRDNERAGPQVWNMPITLFREINLRSIDKKSNAPILVDDPEDGFDIVFSRVGTDKRTKYSGVEVLRDPSPVHDEEDTQSRWLEYILERPLPEVLEMYDPDHIQKVLFGQSQRATSTEEEGEEVTRPPRRSARRRSDEDEDGEAWEDEDASEEEEEEEDTEPRRRRPSRSAATSKPTRRRRSSREDEEDEDASEEEEDTKPTRRRRSSREDEEDEDEDPSEDEEDEAPTGSARRQLDRMRKRRTSKK